jgi:hypothetical protein
MAKGMSADSSASGAQHSSNLKNAIFILPIIALIALIWLILLKIGELPDSLTFNWEFNTWLNFWMVILVILIVILICIPQTGEQPKAEEVTPSKAETAKKIKKTAKKKPVTMVTVETVDKPVEFVPIGIADDKVKGTTKSKIEPAEIKLSEKEEKEILAANIVAPAVKKDKITPKVIEYPKEVEGGIYGDTFININDGKVLKLRTLVVEDIYLL